MNLLLVTPHLPEARSGNYITAARYKRIFEKLGHRVRLTEDSAGESADAMVALHARRSHPSIRRFAEQQTAKPLVVVLTGTDLYRDIHSDADAQASLDLATRLVVLQRKGLDELAERHRAKTAVVYQSVIGCRPARNPPTTYFRVAVVGHLRPEKDSLRTPLALRELSPESRIRAVHAGSALEDDLGRSIKHENATNPRYRWLGSLPHWKT